YDHGLRAAAPAISVEWNSNADLGTGHAGGNRSIVTANLKHLFIARRSVSRHGIIDRPVVPGPRGIVARVIAHHVHLVEAGLRGGRSRGRATWVYIYVDDFRRDGSPETRNQIG